MSNETTLSRRGFFMKLGILFNGLVATALAVPIVGFLFSFSPFVFDFLKFGGKCELGKV